ncbi:bifunctional response regulator/alkaline phosphatase family protein, partial [Paramuribaculum intestinale]
DEIDMLRPHIMFLESKGYELTTVCSGSDALEAMESAEFDMVILDEHMPGITGLQTLQSIKQQHPHMPVIMITKSEEENIMERAIGSRIADYLIKPVNPNQILLSIKKTLDGRRLVADTSTSGYRAEFGAITASIAQCATLDDWRDLYRRLVYWQTELSAQTHTLQADTAEMASILATQIDEANTVFGKFIRRNYRDLLLNEPLTSPGLIRSRVMPLLKEDPVWFVVIDNFRLDQWLALKSLLSNLFTFSDETLSLSILPTSTQFARNAIFAGMMPSEIKRRWPDLWVDDDAAESKNMAEERLLAMQLERHGFRERMSYSKIFDSEGCEQFISTMADRADCRLNAVVINFIDMLSHARTESRTVRELASTDAAYLSITDSWLRHSPTLELFSRIAATGQKVVLATDHGTIRVATPQRIVGDRTLTTNLRYKAGRGMDYNARQVMVADRPAEIGLPVKRIGEEYVFATGRDFFAYPNNYNHYAQYYRGTFQHGGISMEEMLVPLVTLTSKL